MPKNTEPAPNNPVTSLVLCQANEDTTRNGENNFVGLSTMKIIKELFARYARSGGRHFRELEEPGLPNHSIIGKRLLRR